MRVVLVRPRDPNNIGAAARAMANFGVSDLVVVAPHPPVWDEVRSAVGASAVIAAAAVVPTLAEAVADCRLVAGTTAGTRRRLADPLTPAAYFGDPASRASDAALVFGNEKHGLTAEELDACHVVVSIPSRPEQPSLNLAHAVAVCCYEAARDGGLRPSARARRDVGARIGELAAFLEAVEGGPLAGRPPQLRAGAVRRLRALLLRARATRAELALLRGLLGAGDRT